MNENQLDNDFGSLQQVYETLIGQLKIQTGLADINTAENDYLASVGALDAYIQAARGDDTCSTFSGRGDVSNIIAAIETAHQSIATALEGPGWPSQITISEWSDSAKAVQTGLSEEKAFANFKTWYTRNSYAYNLLVNHIASFLTLVENFKDTANGKAEYSQRIAALKAVDATLGPYVSQDNSEPDRQKLLLKNLNANVFVPCPDSQGRSKTSVVSISATPVFPQSPVPSTPAPSTQGNKLTNATSPAASVATSRPVPASSEVNKDVATIECPSTVMATLRSWSSLP